MEPQSEARSETANGRIDRTNASLDEPAERSWIPMAIAGFVVIAIVAAGLLLTGHPRSAPAVSSISATPDPYAPNLPITRLAMSESSNLAGGKVTYIDGHIANTGTRTVTGITVQVLFRSFTHEVAQNETLPLRLIRMREPYIDTVPVSAAPMKPGSEQDFRLIFDKLSPDWAGALPEIKVLHVDSK